MLVVLTVLWCTPPCCHWFHSLHELMKAWDLEWFLVLQPMLRQLVCVCHRLVHFPLECFLQMLSQLLCVRCCLMHFLLPHTQPFVGQEKVLRWALVVQATDTCDWQCKYNRFIMFGLPNHNTAIM